MTAPNLFSNASVLSADEASRQAPDAGADLADYRARIRRSALWAAYGDALGWISELTDEAGLKRRTAGAPLCRPIEWTRRIGGRSGVTTSLPQGCYSDDSQLRLATSRAIRPDGFDVEAFAKVELPVWLSYALGGGKSTSTAAEHLAKPKAPWFANTFRGWTRSGGNGAAMRIQPHVWAARAPDNAESFLPDVIRNTICTHSHPTGLMGAVLHALALAHTMSTGHHPSPDHLLEATRIAATLPEIMQRDIEVGSYWLAAFERESGTFNEAWARAVAECREAIQVASVNKSNTVGADRYADIIDSLRLRDPSLRGSGILSAVAAVGLIWCETRPEEALRIAANAIGTDTDTIATMAGAILGVAADIEPPVEVLDADLFRSEADRLAEIACGGQPQSHRYPDLLHWSAPRTRADTLARLKDGSLYVRGLGRAGAVSEPIPSPKDNFEWQWLKLEAGQTLLIKRRKDLVCGYAESGVLLERQSRSFVPSAAGMSSELRPGAQRMDQTHLPDIAVPETTTRKLPERSRPPRDLQPVLDYMEKNKDNPENIMAALRKVVNTGTRGEIAAVTAAFIDLLRQPE